MSEPILELDDTDVDQAPDDTEPDMPDVAEPDPLDPAEDFDEED